MLNIYKRIYIIILALFILMLSVTSIFAASKPAVIRFHDNHQYDANISTTDVNKLLVIGDKITDINGVGNNFVVKSNVEGSLYMHALSHKPFTLFLNTRNGHTVTLLVHPKPIVGSAVILKPMDTHKHTYVKHTSAYIHEIVWLMCQLILGKPSEYYSCYREKNNFKFIFSGAIVKAQTRCVSQHHIAQIYTIKNKSHSVLSLRPEQFYQHGVESVALSHEQLKPGATSMLYQIKARHG